jgi:hypothetical protein|tara:strand:- start:8651 stop:8815 length:165 start_codon:yes stop_codon:yes gene_type:complete
MGCGCGKLRRGQKMSKSRAKSKSASKELRKKKLINYSLISSPTGRRIKVKKKSK